MVHTVLSLIFEKSMLLQSLTTTHSRFSVTCYNILETQSTVFSSIDLTSDFWQIPLDVKSREITAFSTPSGHYEWLRLPMGLRNAPLTFQRMVNSLFSGLIGNGMFCYLDDLIIVSKDLESHLHTFLSSPNLKKLVLRSNSPNCHFLKSRIEFLGHVVD